MKKQRYVRKERVVIHLESDRYPCRGVGIEGEERSPYLHRSFFRALPDGDGETRRPLATHR